jgi:hypothetical protein
MDSAAQAFPAKFSADRGKETKEMILRSLTQLFFVCAITLAILPAVSFPDEIDTHESRERFEVSEEPRFSKVIKDLETFFGGELTKREKGSLKLIFMMRSDENDIATGLMDFQFYHLDLRFGKQGLEPAQEKFFEILLEAFGNEGIYSLQKKMVLIRKSKNLTELLDMCRWPDLSKQILERIQNRMSRFVSYQEYGLYKLECLRRHFEKKAGDEAQGLYRETLRLISYEFSRVFNNDKITQFTPEMWKKVEKDALKLPYSQIDPERFQILRQVGSLLPPATVVKTLLPAREDGSFTHTEESVKLEEGQTVTGERVDYASASKPSRTFAIICENGKCGNGAMENAVKFTKAGRIPNTTAGTLKELGDKAKKGLKSGADTLIVMGHGLEEIGLKVGEGSADFLDEENARKVAEEFRGYKRIIFHSCVFGKCTQINDILAEVSGAQIIANDMLMYSGSVPHVDVRSHWVITTPITSKETTIPSFMIKRPSLWERFGLCSPRFPCKILGGSR